MVYCLSCEKYPRDSYLIPQYSDFPIDVFKVRLISSTKPSPLPTSGADVVGLADTTKFSVGSKLYVTNGEDGSEIYVYDSQKFVLWSSKWHKPIPGGDNTSDIVGVGEVDYMILTM